MSIKVYSAVYVPLNKLSVFQTEMRYWAHECLKHRLWDQDNQETGFAKMRKYWTDRTLETMSSERSITDVMFSFAGAPKGRGVVLLPSMGDGLRYANQVSSELSYEDKIKTLDFVKDFSYWDNVDPDEDVPPAEWARRRKFFRELFYGNKEGVEDFPITIQIVSPGIENLFQIDPLYDSNRISFFKKCREAKTPKSS